MKLIHYSQEKFELDKTRSYLDAIPHHKPFGFWVSVKGKEDWKWWSLQNDYDIQRLRHAYQVKLKKNHNILIIDNLEKMGHFAMAYYRNMKEDDWRWLAQTFLRHQKNTDLYYLAQEGAHRMGRAEIYCNFDFWKDVKRDYSGIIIPKYYWQLRLHPWFHWYYGWDCSSGCIWDFDCIKSITYSPKESDETLGSDEPSTAKSSPNSTSV